MSSDDGTVSSPSQNQDFPQDSAASEDETNEKLRREIDALIDEYGRDLFLEVNSKIVSNLSDAVVEERKEQKAAFDIKEKFIPDELKNQIENLIAEHGRELYVKVTAKANDLSNLTSELGGLVVLDDYQKRKRGESPAFRESTSLLGKYESPGESEVPSQGSVNRQVIACLTPVIVSGDDEVESNRMKKKIKIGEGSTNPDHSQEPSSESTIQNLSAKRRLDYDSAEHGVKNQDEETEKENKLEDKIKKEESSGSVQKSSESSDEEKKMEMEDDSKDPGKSHQ